MPLAVLGMYLLVGYGWNHLTENYKIGVYLGLAAALWYTFYILAIRRSQTVLPKLQPIANLALITLISALMLALLCLAEQQSFVISGWRNISSLIAYGIFCQIIGWLLISVSLPKIKVALVGFILLLQPSLTMVWGALFFQRPTPAIEIVGACVSLLAIYLSSTARKGRE